MKSKVRCPYCEHRNLVKEDKSKMTCVKCQKPFRVNIVQTVRYEPEPLESIMSQRGYLITEVKPNTYALSKVVDEFDNKSDAMDALLDKIEETFVNTVNVPKITNVTQPINKYF